ncbi:hypothetical protein BHE74_00015364 [Ensete ventricosum]|nr:hypothetical protein GW17_00030128 [Ensete ventricosum]RWW76540.1 hypothetical protein BHE74_00015364 [Ensete ventricosum]RZR94705.1 hypothetical protein BHM03_00023451 [Ensete ventricosum]
MIVATGYRMTGEGIIEVSSRSVVEKSLLLRAERQRWRVAGGGSGDPGQGRQGRRASARGETVATDHWEAVMVALGRWRSWL